MHDLITDNPVKMVKIGHDDIHFALIIISNFNFVRRLDFCTARLI